MAEMELTGEVYPKIVRWRDREFPVSWYELVLDPKKLHKHLQVIKEHPDSLLKVPMCWMLCCYMMYAVVVFVLIYFRRAYGSSVDNNLPRQRRSG